MGSKSLIFLAAALVVTGCAGGGGGGGAPARADVSGVLFDASGNIVRNANVSFIDVDSGFTRQTVSNSNGAYILKDLPASDDVIVAQITTGGIAYFGQNLARLYPGERTMTVNISLYPQNQLASLSGNVQDNKSFLLVGAKIFAIPHSGAATTSAYGITDFNGNYFIGGLVSGQAYDIQVNGSGYNSAFDSQTFTAGQTKTVNYTLAPASTGSLPPPANVSAIAFTSPSEVTSNLKVFRAMSAIKTLANPNRKMRPMVVSKPQDHGSPIEVDLSWTPITNTALLGFGIYSDEGSGHRLVHLDDFRDPLANVYEDMSNSLQSGVTYKYGITTLASTFSGKLAESAMSTTVSVQPLGPMDSGTASSSATPTFTWQPATGASTYAILLFDRYPDLGVLDVFDNLANHVSTTSFTYNGPALTSAHTYYYVVVGFSTTGDQSISQVGQFTTP